MTDEGVEILANSNVECGAYSALTCLMLRWSETVTNRSMWALRHLTSLITLDIRGYCVDDMGMLSLSTLPALTYLDIGYIDVTDEGLRALAQLPALTTSVSVSSLRMRA